MKKGFVVLVLALFSYASELKLSANITALKHSANALYIGTDAGEILKYDLNLKKLFNNFSIKLPAVQNYYESNVAARIHSFDVFEDSFLLLSEGDFGTQNLSLCTNLKLKKGKCLTIKSPFSNVKKVFYLDKNTALLVLLSSDIKLVNLNIQNANLNAQNANLSISTIKEFKFSHTSLNDATLENQAIAKTEPLVNKASAKGQNLLVASESGQLQVFDLKAWKLLANYDKIHKDTLEQVDFTKGIIISCGKEKKLGLVKENEQKFLQKTSFIYSCALSPSGEIAAFSSNVLGKESTEIVSTADFKQIALFDEGDFFAKFIIFLNEKDFLMANNNTILFRSIK